jgi:hypothetical protein
MSPLQPEETHADLKSLVGIIQTLPGDVQRTLTGPMVQLNNSLNRKAKILGLVRDALNQLRLDMKYLMFDLEATRRERDEFKQLWENR